MTDGAAASGLATVVLVHGAGHGPWCWERVVAALEPRGVPTVLVDRRRAPREDGAADRRVIGDLHENARLVRAALDATPGSLVLVGHSAGGPIITEAAAGHPRVRRLVYLCASMPAEDGVDPTLHRDPAYQAALRPQPDGTTTVEPDDARRAFYSDCSEEDAAWAIERLAPQERPPEARQRPAGVAWREIPATFVVCGRDRTIRPDAQRENSRDAAEVVEWPVGHSPFLNRPELVAELLERLAREAALDAAATRDEAARPG